MPKCRIVTLSWAACCVLQIIHCTLTHPLPHQDQGISPPSNLAARTHAACYAPAIRIQQCDNLVGTESHVGVLRHALAGAETTLVIPAVVDGQRLSPEIRDVNTHTASVPIALRWPHKCESASLIWWFGFFNFFFSAFLFTEAVPAIQVTQ